MKAAINIEQGDLETISFRELRPGDLVIMNGPTLGDAFYLCLSTELEGRVNSCRDPYEYVNVRWLIVDTLGKRRGTASIVRVGGAARQRITWGKRLKRPGLKGESR